MAESPKDRKTSQQNLLNYISHNLGRKSDKEKNDCKNSSTKGTIPDRVSANSGPQPTQPKASAQVPSMSSAPISSSKPTPHGPLATKQHPSSSKGKTPSNCQQVKSRTPPSLEKTDKPQKRLNLDNSNMEVDPQTENPSLTQDSSSITCSNEDRDTTRQNLTMDPNTPAS